MKTLAWTGVWLAAAVSSLAAQQSYVWVANGGGNSVSVQTPAGANVATLSAGYSFNQPYDVVAVPRYNLMVVSNNGAAANAHLTLIDSRTFAFAGTVDLLNATNARGMSVSGDEEWVFVAAKHNLTDPGVYQLRMSDLTGSLLGAISDASNFAEDCVVINAAQVGGSGNAPGKVYYSVPGGDYIGVLQFPSGASGSISLATGSLSNIGTPTQLERSSDHSLVMGACLSSSNDFQILRIVPGATDSATEPVVFNHGFPSNEIIDVAFRPGGPPYRAYAITQHPKLGVEVYEIDGTGAQIVAVTPVTMTTVNGRIRFDSTPPRLYIGDTSGTSNQYGRSDASSQPIGARVLVAAGTGPRSFAFSVVPPAPVIDRICPNGQVTTATSQVEIRGSGFFPSSVVAFIDIPGVVTTVPFVFVDAGTLLADVSGLSANLYDVRVTNPDTQVVRLATHYLAIAAPGLRPNYTVNLPSRFQGYRMLSFPQFYTGADLFSAVQTQLGGYNPSFVRIFVQNGSGYQELPSIASGTMCDLSGRSFWALTRFGSPLTLNAPAVGSNTQAAPLADQRVIIVRPGWNMICQPQVNGANERMNLSDILVYQDSALTLFQGGLDVVATATATSFPIEFVNGAYVALTAADLMAAGRGYWLRNNTAASLYLSFQVSDAVLKTKPMAAMTVAPIAGLSSADLTPPPPPAAVTEEDSDSSGCGALGLEALLALAFLRAARRRRLAA